MTSLLLALVLHVSVQDQLEGAEIGDAIQAITFATDGKYRAERKEKIGTSRAKGTWTVQGGALDVKITSCTGPACKTFGQSFQGNVSVRGDRAMAVKASSESAALASGSYYCHYQGCEKRLGVELTSHGAKGGVVRYLLDFLIEKNHGRNVTVVWWGDRLKTAQAQTQVTYCRREEARAKAGADAVAKDLRELSWLGNPQVTPGETDCTYDIRVQVGDTVNLPSKT